FVVQFVGLRGMHWSASVVQLGAIAIMAVLRALVRRSLAKNPKSRALLPGYELDWLAMVLADPRLFHLIYTEDDEKTTISPPEADEKRCISPPMSWRVSPVQDYQ